MKSDLKIRTAYVSAGNLEALIQAEWLPVFIIRSIKNSPLIGKYHGTPVHLYWLAPHPEVFHLYRDKKIDFDEYADIYADDILRSVKFPRLIETLEILRTASSAKGIVLMGYGEDMNKCHRSILAQILNESGLLEHPIKEFVI